MYTGPTMVELEASSPAHTNIPLPSGCLKMVFLVSSLQDDPALNVCTGEQEQLGSWLESSWGARVSAIRTHRTVWWERPAAWTTFTDINSPKVQKHTVTLRLNAPQPGLEQEEGCMQLCSELTVVEVNSTKNWNCFTFRVLMHPVNHEMTLFNSVSLLVVENDWAFIVWALLESLPQNLSAQLCFSPTWSIQRSYNCSQKRFTFLLSCRMYLLRKKKKRFFKPICYNSH